jgi:hypothetical protein
MSICHPGCPFTDMQVTGFCMGGAKVQVLPCMKRLKTAGRTGTADDILHCIEVQFNATEVVVGKLDSMTHRLAETPLFVYEDVFKGDDVKKWIVDYVDPNILRQVVFMYANGTVFL